MEINNAMFLKQFIPKHRMKTAQTTLIGEQHMKTHQK